MKVAPKIIDPRSKLNALNSPTKKFRTDSARFREPALVHKTDVPVLSDSLLRRIDHARHLNNQNSSIQNLPLLPILKSYESRRILSSSKSRQNLGSARQLNSASSRTPQAQVSKKIPKSTKISTFNSTLNSANSKPNDQPSNVNSSLSQTSINSVNSSAQMPYLEPATHQLGNKDINLRDLKEGFLMEDIFQNGIINFKEKYSEKGYQSNSNQSQSNLLRSLRNDMENSNTTEIIVRPIPVNTNKYNEGIKKNTNSSINLTPFIKNFRLNSFDFHGEFNLEKHMKNTQILKPLTDFNLKSNSKLSNKNYELATNGSNHGQNKSTIISSNKSINYLAAGILNPKNALKFTGSSHSSLNRKLDLDDFEYYDVQELFKKNPAMMKSGVFRKKLSQINEESTIGGTPLTNSRWSSSLSNFSGKTIKFDSDEVDNDIWSDIDENNLPVNISGRQSKQRNDLSLAIKN